MNAPRTQWIAALLALALALAGPVHSAAEDRPDVLLITIDDLNDWVGCLSGHPQIRTPNLDALANRGVLFTNAHCQAPVCNPSRVSLFTGWRPSSSGVYQNGHRFRKSSRVGDVETLPQIFHRHGYATLGCGKLFHGSRGRDNFQTYGPSGGQGPLPPERLHMTKEGSPARLWDWGAYPPTKEEAHDFIHAQWAADQLRKPVNGPRFLGVGFYRPHVPCYAPPEWIQKYPQEIVQLPPFLASDREDLPEAGRRIAEERNVAPAHPWMVEHGKWKGAVAAYLACIEFVDFCLGKVLEGLESGPRADTTWIFLTGDHGFHLGEKAHWAKRTLWERSTRVPMIVVPPSSAAGWARGEACGKAVEMLSFFPTMLEVCGLPAREALEGRSLVPLLRDPQEPTWVYPAITTHLRGNHAIRSERWRYIRYADGSEELYDHANDPNEWSNLAGRPDLAGVLREHRRWLPETNVPPMR